MSESPLKTNIDENGIGWVILNRPEVHNCFDDALIKELVVAFDNMSTDDNVRAIVLASEGKSFSAGADLNWMKRVAKYSPEENKADAKGTICRRRQGLSRTEVVLEAVRKCKCIC